MYNLAADMGGMGFIERHRVDCLRSILINTHLIEAAWRAGAQRYFFSSSACAYNTDLQKDPKVRALEGVRRVPGHGGARLRLGEAALRDVLPGVHRRTRPADVHRPVPQRVWPLGTWDGGREKAPAALCRKVIEAKDTGATEIRSGETERRRAASCTSMTAQRASTRSCTARSSSPRRSTSAPRELVSINDLVTLAETIGGVKLTRHYDPTAPRGVAGRNSDNTMIHRILGWEPDTSLKDGLAKTYQWIEQQYSDRKAGKPTVS